VEALPGGYSRPVHQSGSADGGTPVGVWRRWQREFPPLEIDRCRALVVVAPHPDDETLGLGGTAALLAGRGVGVHVVAVTDGEAAYPRRGPGAREELGKVRRKELVAARIRLGIPRPRFLGFPDRNVADHEERLADMLTDVLREFPAGTWCAATWRGDDHPDHEACGRAAAAAADSAGTVFLEYPISMWHWASPDDDRVPWNRARRVPLTPAEIATKAVAVQCFSSLLEPEDGPPVVSPEMVDRLRTVGEIVFV
jgi:LmbE family N-acetylglucosaminyl deacetylase